MIHEDDRRILEDWPEAKIITAKTSPCVLGGHYHKIKTEKFILVEGRGKLLIERGSLTGSEGLVIGKLYTIKPFWKHTFILEKGAVLIGLCSHPFDPNDDFR